MRERSVYSSSLQHRLEAETTHEREERLQQLSDNQQRKLDTETTAHARPIMHSILLVIKLVNAEHYGASVREVADGTKNADSAGLNRFPIRPATFARSAAHAQ